MYVALRSECTRSHSAYAPAPSAPSPRVEAVLLVAQELPAGARLPALIERTASRVK